MKINSRLSLVLMMFSLLLCSVPGSDVEAQNADAVTELRQELTELSAQIQVLIQKQDSLNTRLDALEAQTIVQPSIAPQIGATAPSIPPTPITDNPVDDLLESIANEWLTPGQIGNTTRLVSKQCGNWDRTMNTFRLLKNTVVDEFTSCFCGAWQHQRGSNDMQLHHPPCKAMCPQGRWMANTRVRHEDYYCQN